MVETCIIIMKGGSRKKMIKRKNNKKFQEGTIKNNDKAFKKHKNEEIFTQKEKI